jgi:nucleotide-binding universal stress UspA family protein
MTTILEHLDAEVARFEAWSDTRSQPVAQRPGGWEGEYPGWVDLYQAFRRVVATIPCSQWSETTSATLLYVLGLDNDLHHLAQEVAKNPALLVCMAERAITSSDADAKYQLAIELGKINWHKPERERLLLHFAQDTDEYVRRRAVMALADMGSEEAERLAEELWQAIDDEHARISVLYALRKVGSSRLDAYLSQADAEADVYPVLAQYARRVGAGDAV